MKKWIFISTLTLCSMLTVQAVELEKWTYINTFTPLINAKSTTGTGSAFGLNTTKQYLSQYLNGTALIANLSAPASYFQGISAPSYAGNTSGAYKISFDIVSASFANTGTGKGQFGWGLRSNASGTDDCNVLFRYDNGEFQLVATDASGTRTPVTIATGSILTNLSVSMIFNLESKGSPDSFLAFYQFGEGQPMPILPQQLALPNDFQIDEFSLQFDMTSPGFSWAPNSDAVFFDNLIFETITLDVALKNVGQQVSFIEDNGVISGADTYEPGDVLQIITENLNDSIITVTNVSTSLSADPTAFAITPSSTNFPSLSPNETYTATYQVEILDGALNGSNTFTIVNQIGSGTSAMTFPAQLSIK